MSDISAFFDEHADALRTFSPTKAAQEVTEAVLDRTVGELELHVRDARIGKREGCNHATRVGQATVKVFSAKLSSKVPAPRSLRIHAETYFARAGIRSTCSGTGHRSGVALYVCHQHETLTAKTNDEFDASVARHRAGVHPNAAGSLCKESSAEISLPLAETVRNHLWTFIPNTRTRHSDPGPSFGLVGKRHFRDPRSICRATCTCPEREANSLVLNARVGKCRRARERE